MNRTQIIIISTTNNLSDFNPEFRFSQHSKQIINAIVFLLLMLIITIMPGCHNEPKKVSNSKDTLVQYPEKAKMLLLTDRPPQLETPIKVFRQDFTPNESFFVRWHLARVLTQIDMDTFRLEVVGQVKTTLKLSLTDLKTKFKPY